MIITILNVGEPQKVKTYFTLEVNYKDDRGQTQGKKLMSFTNAVVFNTVKALQAGDVVEVTTKKNDAGYWEWIEVKKATAPAQAASSPTSGFVAGSSDRYETKEERAKRQVMIVRQSSLSTAVATLSVGSKGALNPNQVIEVAREYEAYVLGEGVQGIIDLKDDIPE